MIPTLVIDSALPARDRVVQAAMAWERTPYRHHGCVRGVGVDCGNLLAGAFHDAGVIPGPFDPGPYSHEWQLHQTEELFRAALRLAGFVELPLSRAVQPGDVALWKMGNTYSHAGLVIDTDPHPMGCLLLHALLDQCVQQVRLLEEPVGHRPVEFWIHPALGA